MIEEFEEEALQYLLDEMEAGRRVAFEQRLAHDAEARAALKRCADGLARFACETAPAEPMVPVDQRVTLAAILAAAKTEPPRGAAVRPVSNVIPWTRYFWPMAAAVLLGLNLLNFERPIQSSESTLAGAGEFGAAERPEMGGAAEGEAAVGERNRNGAGVDDVVDASGQVAGATAGGAVTKGERDVIRPASEMELRRELDRLRGAYANLERGNAALRADYESVMMHITQRAVAERGLGRLAAMELVDAASYARGNRKGLVELARGILTEPGVVAVDRATTPVPGFVVDPATPGRNETDPDLGITIEPEIPDTESPAVAASVPYAWSVFDENENRGYLNLYNLPTVAPDAALQLWVKGPGEAIYQHVGEVPAEFQGGSGSVLYTLPETSPAPVEILVTEEARGAAAGAPMGTVVLRGP